MSNNTNNRLNRLYSSGKILFGGDYNPEQWLDHPEILSEDIRLMKKARINVATLGVFSWSVLEPKEGSYRLDWLEDIINNLYDNGIYTVLATPSGAHPVWLDETYPEALRVDKYGVKQKRGLRHNHCMSSPAFRKKAVAINAQLANRFGSNPAVILWHISNELGGECYCDLCKKKFQDYLEEKFDHDIENLNKAWWTTFWSHKYQTFSQIEPPFADGETSIMGLNLEWKRFTTWNMTDCMKEEIEVFRKLTPDIPVTTNFMELYDGLDYRAMEPELDIISWDSYPAYHKDSISEFDTAIENSFNHAVFRGLKKNQPFMVMESAPGLVNWHPFNKMQRPGMYSLMAMQSIANGSDSAMYFQWRKGRGSSEQYHGAVIGHSGSEHDRIYREVAQTGELLEKLSIVMGSTISARAAVLFDWDTRWSIQDMRALSNQTKQYEKTVYEEYRALIDLGVETDIIGRDNNLEDYDIVVAPMMYMLSETTAENLMRFVERGGQLIATYLCGYVDSNTLTYLGGFPGDNLMRLFGIYAEEIDTLYESDINHAFFDNGRSYVVTDYAEYIHILEDSQAKAIAFFESDYYEGMPAITCNSYGKGNAWYVAARMERDGRKHLYKNVLKSVGILPKLIPANVEYHMRENAVETYEFYLNHSNEEVTLRDLSGIDMMTGKETPSLAVLAPKSFLVLCNKK